MEQNLHQQRLFCPRYIFQVYLGYPATLNSRPTPQLRKWTFLVLLWPQRVEIHNTEFKTSEKDRTN